MKKTYKKPEIMFEDFSLSTSIAAACEYGASHTQYVCAYEDEFLEAVIFTNDIDACTTKMQDGAHNGICYHVPAETSNIFAS